MFLDLIHHLQQPEKFKHSDNLYWKDPYIAKFLLEAHLNSRQDMASRNFEFIDQSVDFIEKTALEKDCNKIIDYGCGPGLYCERLAQKGFDVTGIDFSKNSIQYAKNNAKNKGLNITYRYENYLDITDENQYGFVTLIYCDYGSLAPHHRKQLLQNIWNSLRTEGLFLLDVFTVHKYIQFTEGKHWSRRNEGGFWSPEAHIELTQNLKYDGYVSLEQTTIITKQKVDTYYRWYQFFTKKMIVDELEKAGFTLLSVYNDVAGNDYLEGNETIALLLKK